MALTDFRQRQKNMSVWLVFVSFLMVLFTKIAIFHYFCFNSLLIKSIIYSPIDFWYFWCPKITISLFCASFIFISRQNWWTIILLILADIWILTNFIYFRSYGLFINIEAIQMAGNMNGFWESITTYWNWKCWIFLLLTLLYCPIIILFPYNKKLTHSLIIYFITLFVCFVNDCSFRILYYREYISWGGVQNNHIEKNKILKDCLIPFRLLKKNMGLYVLKEYQEYEFDSFRFVKNHSVISYLPEMIMANIYYKHEVKNAEKYRGHISISDIDVNDIEPFICNTQTSSQPNSNIILIIVESLEDWVFHTNQICDEEVVPNLKKWYAQGNILYCSKVISQIKQGGSGDGQMIVNTGLLPLNNGAACISYSSNTYPNWNQFYTTSATINPCPGSWNQQNINSSYGYKQLVELTSKRGEWSNDKDIFNRAINYLDSIPEQQDYSLQIITISTHTPFRSKNMKQLSFPKDTPDDIANYLTCMHYTDSCIGNFLYDYKIKQKLNKSTIIITGDHIIFQQSLLKEFQQFSQKYDLPIKNCKTYVPLIIFSPNITQKTEIQKECYQMDIYPTIMNIIGCKNYYWKGFGVNMLDSVALHNRPIDEKMAYQISDKLIRSNFFAKPLSQQQFQIDSTECQK